MGMDTIKLRKMTLTVVGVAALWWLTFHFNDWIAAAVQVNDHVNWLFLPAALRVLAVLMFGAAGVLGLFLGSVAVDVLRGAPLNWLLVLVPAALSSLAPALAAWMIRRWYGIPLILSGLTQAHLFRVVVLSALVNGLSQQAWWVLSGVQAPSLLTLAAMVVGDVLGGLVVMYALSLLIDWVEYLMDRRSL